MGIYADHNHGNANNDECLTCLAETEMDDEMCDDCGHFHDGFDCPDPYSPCGDYRCCIN